MARYDIPLSILYLLPMRVCVYIRVGDLRARLGRMRPPPSGPPEGLSVSSPSLNLPSPPKHQSDDIQLHQLQCTILAQELIPGTHRVLQIAHSPFFPYWSWEPFLSWTGLKPQGLRAITPSNVVDIKSPSSLSSIKTAPLSRTTSFCIYPPLSLLPRVQVFTHHIPFPKCCSNVLPSLR